MWPSASSVPEPVRWKQSMHDGAVSACDACEHLGASTVPGSRGSSYGIGRRRLESGMSKYTLGCPLPHPSAATPLSKGKPKRRKMSLYTRATGTWPRLTGSTSCFHPRKRCRLTFDLFFHWSYLPLPWNQLGLGPGLGLGFRCQICTLAADGVLVVFEMGRSMMQIKTWSIGPFYAGV